MWREIRRTPEYCRGIKVNEHRCLSKLGTRAVYRVLSFDDELVWVEVVTAPGLEPGRRLRLTRTAVEAMTAYMPDTASSRQPNAITDRATS